jgi:hypothetical protein
MQRLEKVNSFLESVQIFSQLTNEVVEFVQLAGDRKKMIQK